MHRIKILRTLVSASLFLTLTSVATAAKVDVYKEFQEKISFLEKSLPKEKDAGKRYDLFLKTFKEMSDLRAKNPRVAEDKEINMSFFMDALAPLPGKKDFDIKKCPEYQKEVTNAAKSYDESQKDVFSDKAVEITKLICKTK